MKSTKRAALIAMMTAILNVSSIDEFTRYRDQRLLARLGALSIYA